MTIKELIELLQEFNEDTEVYIDWKWSIDFIKDDTFINDIVILF